MVVSSVSRVVYMTVTFGGGMPKDSQNRRLSSFEKTVSLVGSLHGPPENAVISGTAAEMDINRIKSL